MNQTKVFKEDSVSLGGTGKKTVEIFSRKNLHYILLYLTKTSTAVSVANMKTAITDLVVRFNGRAFHEADVTFFLDIEKYYRDAVVSGGDANIAGWIKIPFVRNDLPAAANRMATSVGIDAIKTITLDLQVASLTNLDNVEIYSVYDDGKPRPMGVTRRFSRHNATFGSTGQDQVADLPFEDPDVFGWLAAHIKYSTATLDHVSVKVNGNDEIYQLPPTGLQALAQEQHRAPQSGYAHVDFAKDRDALMYLDMPAKSLRLTNQWSSAAPSDYNIYLERLYKEPASK